MYRTNFFDGFFDDFIQRDTVTNAKSFYNKETKTYEVFVSTPGFSNEEIDVELKGDKLVISGELENEDVIRKVGPNSFSYFVYQKNIDADSIQATLDSGILSVEFKVKEPKPDKKVKIKVLE